MEKNLLIGLSKGEKSFLEITNLMWNAKNIRKQGY